MSFVFTIEYLYLHMSFVFTIELQEYILYVISMVSHIRKVAASAGYNPVPKIQASDWPVRMSSDRQTGRVRLSLYLFVH